MKFVKPITINIILTNNANIFDSGMGGDMVADVEGDGDILTGTVGLNQGHERHLQRAVYLCHDDISEVLSSLSRKVVGEWSLIRQAIVQPSTNQSHCWLTTGTNGRDVGDIDTVQIIYWGGGGYMVVRERERERSK